MAEGGDAAGVRAATAGLLRRLPWVHGGDLAAQQLAALGTDRLFTLTGGHISGLYDGCRFAGISLIDFRHEAAVVHAAEGYARSSRTLGVAAVTAGPGVTNAVTGLANARYSETPVLVFGGRNPLATDGAGNLQDAPHIELVRPVAKYTQTLHTPERIGEIILDAARTALTPRQGPAYLDLPVELQLARLATDRAPPCRTATVVQAPVPDPDLVRHVARALSGARRPVIVAGSGCYWARAEQALDVFARTLGAPVFLNGMARGLLGRGHPAQMRTGRAKALLACDLVLVLGADFDFRLGFGQAHALNPEATVIQVDPDGARLGRNRHVDIAVAGDITAFLLALMEQDGLFGRSGAGNWVVSSREAVRPGQPVAGEHGDSRPIDPRWFCAVVADMIGTDTTMIGDGGDIVAMYAAQFEPGGPGQWMDPGPFGCLGIGAPFAIGARVARPTAPVAVLFGDGAFGFNAMEIDAAVRQRLPFVGIIGNDGAWGEMRTFHEDLFGPDDPSAQYLSQATRYDRVAEGLGASGERVEKASQLVPALERAFASGATAVVDVILDPAFRNRNATISGRHVAEVYGRGDPNAFRRNQP